jgi:hypothetical protein
MSDLRPIQELRMELMQQMGIVSYAEQERLIDIARRCAKFGIATGGGWAVFGAPAGLPGFAAGFLSGWATGTASCVAVNYGLKRQLQQLAKDGTWSP